MRSDAHAAAELVRPPAGLRAHVWIEARALFSREEAQRYCWLWTHLDDGHVHAFRLGCRVLGRDELIPPLLLAHGARSGAALTCEGHPVPVQPLPRAPVVPLPRWSYSWGHPLNAAIRAFASTLNADVLSALGRLEEAGAYMGSVANFSRLATLPEPVRTHRLQALLGFPPLVAPLILSLSEQPELFGLYERDGFAESMKRSDGGAPPVDTAAAAVLDAIDRGRDLIGALARYWRVDRALVRSPLLRQVWPSTHRLGSMLRLVNAIPAHSRPQCPDGLLGPYRALVQLLGEPHASADVVRLARCFAHGWDRTWESAMCERGDVLPAMRNARDFLRAALDQVQLPAAIPDLSSERLALAWIARRGLASLLRASQRWHELPTTPAHAAATGMPESVAPLLGELALQRGRAYELTTRAALIQEGETMRHCVGDYWSECVLDGTRVWHLATDEGETATAEFCIDGDRANLRFVLKQLLGPCNARPSQRMRDLAAAVEGRLNDESLREYRRDLVEAVAAARDRHVVLRRPRNLRVLDLDLRRELATVLAYCSRQPDWIAPADVLYRGPLAGFRYALGPHLLHRLQAGDELQLVREPHNPHDPNAVRVDWQGHKIGYVPRTNNSAIARMLDAGETPNARIGAVEPDAGHWEPVAIMVRTGR